MQTWHKNKNEKDNFREVNLVNIITCVTDIWKKNVLKDLKIGELEYIVVGEFLADLKKKILGGEMIKWWRWQNWRGLSKKVEWWKNLFKSSEE